MSKSIKPIPEGYHSITPYLPFKGAAHAIEFYKKAFNAVERFRMPGVDGKSVGHAEISIGNSIIMLSDECAESGKTAPSVAQPASTSFVVYVEDVDSSFTQAVNAGAKVKLPLEDKFWGDRAGTVSDPFGYEWMLMTHKEDVSPDEMKRRMKEACTSHSEATSPA
jgi:PhnB protein